MSNHNPASEKVMQGLEVVISDYLSKNGYSAPSFPYVEISNGMICNLTIYKGDYKDIMREAYIEACESFRMKKDWLDNQFFFPEIQQNVSIIGIDLDGGEYCIRLVASNGRELNAHPIRIKELAHLDLNPSKVYS
ncbi:hypothetical protein LMH73_015350 [Vibrio splendidus]|nr:hypothetical protein [Vibrio splendidus]MCC4881496.1 hypothetical protein [Vibrio splendidus]